MLPKLVPKETVWEYQNKKLGWISKGKMKEVARDIFFKKLSVLKQIVSSKKLPFTAVLFLGPC